MPKSPFPRASILKLSQPTPRGDHPWQFVCGNPDFEILYPSQLRDFDNMIRLEKGMCSYERIENPSMLTDWWFTANYLGKPTSFSDITHEHPLKTKKIIDWEIANQS